MTLRKQLAALLAAGALGFAVMGTALAAGNTGAAEELGAPSFQQSVDPVSEPPASEPPASEPPASEAPSFEQSEDPETEPPVTEPPVTEPPVTEPPVTAPPTPTFIQSEEGETDAPSEPDTTTIGGSEHTGSPADGAWLLVVALGLLLASIVVLTPVRVRNRR